MSREDLKLTAKALEKDINEVALFLHYRDRRGNDTKRAVVPLLLVREGRETFKLIAWCFKRGAVRSFFLSSILNWDPIAPEDLPDLPPRSVLLEEVVKVVLRSRKLKYAILYKKQEQDSPDY